MISGVVVVGGGSWLRAGCAREVIACGANALRAEYLVEHVSVVEHHVRFVEHSVRRLLLLLLMLTVEEQVGIERLGHVRVWAVLLLLLLLLHM